MFPLKICSSWVWMEVEEKDNGKFGVYDCAVNKVSSRNVAKKKNILKFVCHSGLRSANTALNSGIKGRVIHSVRGVTRGDNSE